MKVALCLSGQARFVRQNFPSVKRAILDVADVDVFIHTWTSVDSTRSGVVEDVRLAERLEVYNPRALSLQSQLIFPMDLYPYAEDYRQFDDERRRWLFQRSFSMFYSIWAANELKRAHEASHGFTYDLVLRARTDNMFPENFSPVLEEKVFLYSYRLHESPTGRGYGDQLAYGPSHLMDLYAGLYQQIDGCIHQTRRLHQGSLLSYYLDELVRVPCASDSFVNAAQDKLMRGFDADSGCTI